MTRSFLVEEVRYPSILDHHSMVMKKTDLGINVDPGLINPMVVENWGSHIFKGDLSLLGVPPLVITIGVC